MALSQNRCFILVLHFKNGCKLDYCHFITKHFVFKSAIKNSISFYFSFFERGFPREISTGKKKGRSDLLCLHT